MSAHPDAHNNARRGPGEQVPGRRAETDRQGLSVENLTVSFRIDGTRAAVVENLSLRLTPGSKVAMVGESGSGKSVAALSVLRLLATPPARIESGRIWWNGQDLLSLPERHLRRVRGNEISMVFQDPLSALNPVFTVGYQIVEAIRAHQRISRRQAKQLALSWMERVGIDSPDLRFRAYPHELSGGLRQRVMIAMALVNEPQLLIADEPTSSLDVTTQAQILDLLEHLHERHRTTIWLITHDLAVAASFADRVVVMYAGRVVEQGSTEQVLSHPLHPYTQGLLASVLPDPSDPRGKKPSAGWKAPLPGQIPPPTKRNRGCTFAPRCEFVHQRCLEEAPELVEAAEGHEVRCWGPPDSQVTDEQEVLA